MAEKDPTNDQLMQRLRTVESELMQVKKTKTQLKAASRKDRSLFDGVPLGLYRSTPAGEFLEVNPAMVKMLGYPDRKSLLKERATAIYFDPEDRVRWREQMERVGILTDFETRFKRLDGTPLFCIENAHTVKDSGGRTKYYEGSLVDISGQKRAEEALKESEEKYREVVENVHNIVMRMDPEGNITLFNRFAQEFFGYSEEEILDQNLVGTIVPKSETTGRDLKRLIKKIGRFPERYTHNINENIRQNGERVWVEWTNKPRYDHQGNVVDIFCVGSDITDRKRAEEELKKSEARYRTILNSIGESYFEVDVKGRFTFFNEALCRLYRADEGDLMGQLIGNFTDAETAKKGFKIFNRVFKTGKAESAFGWKIIRLDGETRHVESSVYLTRDEGGQRVGFRGVSRDVTERKAMEDALKREKQNAEAANIAKSQFLANMSHEIRTPMNAIIGFTDFLIDSGLDDSQLDYALTIKSSGDALLSVINDILDFSKIESGELTFEKIDFDPEILAHDVCEVIRPRVGTKPIEILCQIGEHLPALVKGDPGRYRQVLTNLMANATKFTQSGTIELHLDVKEEELDHVLLEAQVKDTGLGIPKHKLKTIFDRFQQADTSTTRKYGGTGLGLSICKQIANLMEGDVWAESRVAQGTCFYFTARFDKVSERKSKKFKPVSLFGKKVLIVDDNPRNLFILTRLLSSVGMHVTALQQSESVMACLKAPERKSDPFHLCIMDIQMPELSGYEVARQIRRMKTEVRDMPLVALSSHMEQDAKKCKSAGFDGFLSKPIRREKLFQMIERMLTRVEGEDPIEPATDDEIMTQYSVMEERKHALRILLAEDNPVNQKLARMMLAKAGYDVEVANNGHEAVERYRDAPEGFDLLFMDVQMPRMDGLTATRKIREIELKSRPGGLPTPERLPIIALTAHAMKGDRAKCMAAGMDDYVSKPIKRESVYQVIDKWVLKKIPPMNRQA